MKAEAMTEAMNIRIIEDLREKVQGIYGGGIQGGLSKEPYPSFQLLVVLPTGPAKVDTLLTALHAEIDTFQQKGPSADLLNKVKKQWLESHKEDLKDNSAWAEALMENKVDKVPFARFLNYERFVNRLTPKDLQEASRLLLNNKNRVIAVQMPEKKKETKAEEKKPF
jgi:zinc protease